MKISTPLGAIVVIVFAFAACVYGIALVDDGFDIDIAKASVKHSESSPFQEIDIDEPPEKVVPKETELKLVPEIEAASKTTKELPEVNWAITDEDGNWTPYGILLFLHQSGAEPEWIVDLAATCLSESNGGNPNAEGDKDLITDKWHYSYGLCQIRSLNSERGTGGVRDPEALKNPRHNLQSAVAIAKEAQAKAEKTEDHRDSALTPWTEFLNGNYRHKLPEVVEVWDDIFETELLWVAKTQVNVSIAKPWADMVKAAKEEGFELEGWGWRSPEKQAQLRVAHCPGVASMDQFGDTSTPMYTLPSSACRPWTAAPGKSAHQSGEVVDVHNWSPSRGRLSGIDSHHPEYKWLIRNACQRFGFKQTVASEPWHWRHMPNDCPT